MIERVLGIDRVLVKHYYKNKLISMDAPPRNGRPSFVSHKQQEEFIRAIVEGYEGH
jgi:hypothetical protein